MILEVKNEADMKVLGGRLGEALDGGQVIELVGDVGAGKTTLVKGLAASLQVEDDVQSPSFTISRVYESQGGVRLVHYDFYRLQDPGILASELAENQTDEQTITVIEWADIVESVLPDDRLRLIITANGEDTRRVEIIPTGPMSQKVVGVLK